MWAYDSGWQESEYSPALGVWRWTTERSTLRIIGPARALRVKLAVESPLRYFEDASLVRAMAGARELAVTTISASREWSFDVPADALVAAGGLISIETNQTFVPAERSGAADQRRLGLRVFLVQVSNLLTPPEVSR
jgi:hypothetical protein